MPRAVSLLRVHPRVAIVLQHRLQLVGICRHVQIAHQDAWHAESLGPRHQRTHLLVAIFRSLVPAGEVGHDDRQRADRVDPHRKSDSRVPEIRVGDLLDRVRRQHGETFRLLTVAGAAIPARDVGREPFLLIDVLPGAVRRPREPVGHAFRLVIAVVLRMIARGFLEADDIRGHRGQSGQWPDPDRISRAYSCRAGR